MTARGICRDAESALATPKSVTTARPHLELQALDHPTAEQRTGDAHGVTEHHETARPRRT
jgi:hypothetical protein